MSLFRWIIGMPLAAAITGALFLMMAGLIRDRGEPLPKAQPDIELKITAEIKETGPNDIKPPRDVIPKEIPPTVFEFPESRGVPDGPIVNPDPVDVKMAPPDTGNGFASPVIRTSPLYPEGCRSRGATGVVIVEFDVTPEGNVTNARIIESPNRCFNRTVLKAVSGWKYPPNKSNGRAVMRYGIVETFNFQLVE